MVTNNAINSPTNQFLQLAGGTMLGNLILNGAPSTGNQAVNKSYADSIAAGIGIKPSCIGATTTNFASTYSNGTAGVGATLTATSVGVTTFDGVTVTTIGQAFLIKNQTSAFQNGIYLVSTVGTASVATVFTRATYFDQTTEINASSVIVTGGSVQINSFWIQDNTVSTVGTDSILFAQVNFASGTYLVISNNLSDLANVATARTNLGLGTAATHAATDFFLVANNLSEGSAVTMRTNLGLGSAALLTSSAVVQTANNLNDLASIPSAVANLGLTIGSDVQAFSNALTSIATVSGGGLLAFDGSSSYNTRTIVGTIDEIDVTNGDGVIGNPIIGISSSFAGSTNITTLGIITTGTWNADIISPAFGGTGFDNGSFQIALGGTISTSQGINTLGDGTSANLNFNSNTNATFNGAGTVAYLSQVLLPANNLSDVSSAATSRTNLGLGSAALLSTSQVLQPANNLSDVSNVTTARTNLGLGSAASLNTNQVLQSANNLSDLGNVVTARTNLGLGTTNVVTFNTVKSNIMELVQGSNTLFLEPGILSGNVIVRLPGSNPIADTGYFLTSTSAGVQSWAIPPTGGSFGINIQKFTSSGTYTPTPGMIACNVKMVAGGGGGGGYSIISGTWSGAGGGAGEYVEATFQAATIGASQSFTIGTGGTAGLIENAPSSALNGGDGTNTTFGGLLLAHGGRGASIGAFGPASYGGNPGNGGNGSSSGDINIAGNPGMYGFVSTHLTGGFIGGNGGSSELGVGATGATFLSDGVTTVGATTPGFGGGGGGSVTGTPGATFASPGGPGYIIITEYL